MFAYCQLNKVGLAAFRRLLRFLTVRCDSSRTCLASKTFGSVREDVLVGCRGCLWTGSRKGIPVCSDPGILTTSGRSSFPSLPEMWWEKRRPFMLLVEYEKHGTCLWNMGNSNYYFIQFGLFFLILCFVWYGVLLCNSGWPGPHCIVSTGLKFMEILLPQHSECQNYSLLHPL